MMESETLFPYGGSAEAVQEWLVANQFVGVFQKFDAVALLAVPSADLVKGGLSAEQALRLNMCLCDVKAYGRLQYTLILFL